MCPSQGRNELRITLDSASLVDPQRSGSFDLRRDLQRQFRLDILDELLDQDAG